MPRFAANCLLCIVFLAAIAPGAHAEDAQDRLIVPGQRAGAITRTTTPADLARIYGAANLKRGKNDGPDDDVFEGIKVYPGTADEFRVLLTQDGRQISHLRFERQGGTWRTAEGIRVGLTVAELEHISGGPFRFYGFAWQYGGLVTLRDNPGTKLPKGLIVALAPQKTLTPAEEEQVDGDKLIASGHPLLAKLDVRVGLIILNFRDRIWGRIN